MNRQQMRRKVLALFGSGLLLLVVLEILLLRILERVAGLLPFILGWLNPFLGLAGVTVGSFLVIWSVSAQVGEGGGTPYPGLPTRKLIVSGPYACTRNPMTLGAALLYLGIALWLGSSAGIVLVLLVFIALLAFIYVHETRELTARFGSEYLDYRRNTPFLIPACKKRPRF